MNFECWCDGSGTTGGPAGIGWVAVPMDAEWIGQADVEVEGSLPLANATNQQAEILACAHLLHTLPPGSDVVVHSDSEYLVVGWNDEGRLPYWRANGWRKRSGGAVKNVAHWQRLIAAAERHAGFALHWLRGHDGHEWNERADALAGLARQQALAARPRPDYNPRIDYPERYMREGVWSV